MSESCSHLAHSLSMYSFLSYSMIRKFTTGFSAADFFLGVGVAFEMFSLSPMELGGVLEAHWLTVWGFRHFVCFADGVLRQIDDDPLFVQLRLFTRWSFRRNLVVVRTLTFSKVNSYTTISIGVGLRQTLQTLNVGFCLSKLGVNSRIVITECAQVVDQIVGTQEAISIILQFKDKVGKKLFSWFIAFTIAVLEGAKFRVCHCDVTVQRLHCDTKRTPKKPFPVSSGNGDKGPPQRGGAKRRE